MSKALKVSESGSVTLPAQVRRDAGIKVGARLNTVVKGRVVMLVPAVDIGELYGAAAGVDVSIGTYREGH